jgi:Rrf2 family transcriptional regulator, nitric oxide-sensitive transcriptional repressor
MQLSLHADYSLRTLIYLATYPERIVRTQEISEAYDISRHHLVRVIQTLAKHDYVNIHAGRSGGVTLSREAHRILLGEVVRIAEPNMQLVECFERETNTCKIAPACALKGILKEGLDAFITSLNRYTLADVLGNGKQHRLAKILKAGT